MKMNGARILVEELIHQGVRVVFGYPGGAVLDIYNELYLASDRIGHVLAAHEQGAAHAADGYARASGKTGVVLATSGPGATNLVTGIANAYLDSVPMVAITGSERCEEAEKVRVRQHRRSRRDDQKGKKAVYLRRRRCCGSRSPERSSGALQESGCGHRSFDDGDHLRSGLLSAESWNVRHARKISVHQGPVRM